MVQMNKTQVVPVEAKTLSIHCKVRDCFDATLKDQYGNVIAEQEGYVPDFMPGDHYGDYLILDIDIDTGFVTNWKTPTAKQLENAFEKEDD